LAKLNILPPVVGLEFFEPDHSYHYASKAAGRVKIDSVSQVLSSTGAKVWNPARWRQKLMRDNDWNEAQANAEMERVRSTRAQIGTDFHALVQQWLLRGGVTADDREAYFMFDHWLEKFFPRIGEVRLVEQPLVHRGALYVGTPDLLAEVDGRLTLVDWKTCQSAEKARVRDDWIMQQGAYTSLIKSCYNLDVHHGMNVMVWDGGVRVQPWNAADLRHGWQFFAGYLMEHHARHAEMGSRLHQAALDAMSPMFSTS
jgi:genome maintenance exonuclease 1